MLLVTNLWQRDAYELADGIRTTYQWFVDHAAPIPAGAGATAVAE